MLVMANLARRDRPAGSRTMATILAIAHPGVKAC
jgi:hypothetical protein